MFRIREKAYDQGETTRGAHADWRLGRAAFWFLTRQPHFAMRLDALQYARGIARKEGSDLYEHRSGGTVKQWESYSLDTVRASKR